MTCWYWAMTASPLVGAKMVVETRAPAGSGAGRAEPGGDGAGEAGPGGAAGAPRAGWP